MFRLNHIKEKFTFPLEGLLAIPVVTVLNLSALAANRLLLRLIYPLGTYVIGVLFPFYVIVKNPKMNQMFRGRFYENPKNFLVDNFGKFKKNYVTPMTLTNV